MGPITIQFISELKITLLYQYWSCFFCFSIEAKNVPNVTEVAILTENSIIKKNEFWILFE